MKSAKIVPATAARSWLFPKISANPLFTLAEKRRFYRPKLPALRAEVDGLAQKSAKPFLLPRRLRLLPPPKAAHRRSGFCAVALPDTPTRRRSVRFSGFRWVRRSAVPRKPHKAPTRARRRGTRCRSQVHLLHLLRFCHFRLRIGGNCVPLTILSFPHGHKLLLQSEILHNKIP